MHSLSLVVCFITILTSSACQVTDEAEKTSEPATCVYKGYEDEVYDLTSLANTNERPRFCTEDSMGYSISYNPCFPFKIGPSKKTNPCHSGVAICRWVEGLADAYVNIGSQRSALFDGGGKHPKIHYHHSSSGINWKSTVSLVCNFSDDKGHFRVVTDQRADHVELSLSHKCACPNVCLINPTRKPKTTATPGDDEDIVFPVVAGVFCLFAVPFIIIIWRRVRPQPPNDNPPSSTNQFVNPLLNKTDPSDYGAVGGNDSTSNPLSSASEPTSGSGSSSLTKPSSTNSSSCNDIKVSSKENSKSSERSYVC